MKEASPSSLLTEVLVGFTLDIKKEKTQDETFSLVTGEMS